MNETQKQTAPFARLVERELADARSLHPFPIQSPHEAHSMLRGLVEDFFDECRNRNVSSSGMLDRLTEISATAQRAAEDLSESRPAMRVALGG